MIKYILLLTIKFILYRFLGLRASNYMEILDIPEEIPGIPEFMVEFPEVPKFHQEYPDFPRKVQEILQEIPAYPIFKRILFETRISIKKFLKKNS